jgi:hypothetical protein
VYVRKRVQRAIRIVVIMIAVAAGAPHAGPLALGGGASWASDGRTAGMSAGNHGRTGGGGCGVRSRRRPCGADGRRGLWQDGAGGEKGGGGARDRRAVARMGMGMGAGVVRRTSARGWGWRGWMWWIAENTGGFE